MSEILKERLSDDLLEGATGGGQLRVVVKDKKTGSIITTKTISTGLSKRPKY